MPRTSRSPNRITAGFEVALGWLEGRMSVALVWLWCGFGVALVWPWCGLRVALGCLCTPESMPSICLLYAFGVALGGLPFPSGDIIATRKASFDNYAVPLVLSNFERGRLAVDNCIRSSYIV